MNRRPQSFKTKFAVLWSGQAVSLFTSSVLQMAIVWYLTDKTGSAAVLSFATLIGYLPAAILGMFIGTFVDRYNRKFIMIIADLSIAMIGIILAISSLSGDVSVGLIMVALLLRSFGTAFHYPALQSTTPTIVPREQLTKYAGYSQSFESLSMVLSPAVAAILFSVWDLTAIIFLDVLGALFAVSTLMLVDIPKSKPSIYKRESLIKETANGLKELYRVKGMALLMMIGALYAIIYFPVGTLYPFITTDYFGGGYAESGIVEAVFAIGSLVGALVLGVAGNKIPKIPFMALSIGIYGVGVLCTGLLPRSGLYFFIMLSIVMGIAVPFYTGIQTAIFQMKFKEEYLGRIFSLSSSVTTLAMPIGLILSGVFTDTIGVNKLFIIAGILAMILSMLLISFRNLRNCCNS